MTRIGLYSGSFDPPSLGHLDIIQKAAKLFDRLYVGVAINQKKNGSGLLSIEQRVKALKSITSGLDNVEITSYQSLTVDFAKSKGVTHLVRGLRSMSHMKEELQIAISNRALGKIETVFLLANEKYAHISSTIIREIASFKGSLEAFVPPEVEAFLTNTLQ